MQKIHTYSDGFGVGHAFPMWPQIISASGFEVVNHSEVSISVIELIRKFKQTYNTHDYFIMQMPQPGRIPGIRMPCKLDQNLIDSDNKLIADFVSYQKSNVHFSTVEQMDVWSKSFTDRGNEVQPQTMVHARWLKKHFPQFIDQQLCVKIEKHGAWEPFHWNREAEWKTLVDG